jgi:hypothetical protein
MHNFLFKQMCKEDLSFLLEIRNDDSTRNNLENNSIFTLEDCEKWFETLNYPWYIIKIDDVSVGYIRTNGIEIGCDIHPNHRRNGYAREAYKLILKEMDIASLWVFDDNFAKILYQELGFKETGEQKIIRSRNYVKMVYIK